MTLYTLGDSKPQLPPEGEYWVAPNASVIGNVILHTNASVWFGAVLRGDNDRITVEWTNTPDGAAKQFRREWFQVLENSDNLKTSIHAKPRIDSHSQLILRGLNLPGRKQENT